MNELELFPITKPLTQACTQPLCEQQTQLSSSGLSMALA